MIAIFPDENSVTDTKKHLERVLKHHRENLIFDKFRYVWPESYTSGEFYGQIPYQRGVKPHLDNNLSI